jgi:hypothetical protein
MRRVLAVVAAIAFAGLTVQSPAEGLTIPVPPFTVGASPNAIPPGNTFKVGGNCQGGNTVKIELVRQARPGAAARVVQRRTATVDAERFYSVTFTNNLTTASGFPVDAQVFASCGQLTAHAPFVSTTLVYPNNNPRFMTLQANGPCGTCVAHLKGFDAYANLSPSSNDYMHDWTRSGSIAAALVSGYTRFVVGSGPGKQATVATGLVGIYPYGDFTGGVEVAYGNVTGDTNLEVVTGPGPGGGPHVKVFTPNNSFGYNEVGGFFAYAPDFTGGVRVAVGDVFGDAQPEIITAAGPGGGPHVRVFTPAGALISEFFAYAPNVTGGVSVAVGDVVPGGKQEIVTGAGPGGAAHVKTFNCLGQAIGNGFYAYDPAFTGGVWVAVGNVDQQVADEIVTGAGAGGMPHVRWFTSPEGAFSNPGFFAYEDVPTGVRVAVPRD